MKFDQIKELKDEKFRRLTGVRKGIFSKMVDILSKADGLKKSKGGRKNKLNLEEQLLMALEYLREYHTYFHIGQNYGISESSAYKAVKWVEDTIVKHPNFALPGCKALMKSDMNYEVVLIDATETPIERPKKKQKFYYSGKKKRHTLKTQIVLDKKTHQVICTDFLNGKKHDFRLFKKFKILIHPKVKVITDTGYQGIQKIHNNSELPKKKSKKNPLTKNDKKNNRRLAAARVVNENVIGMLKRFKIIADKYRNRRKRFGLRFNLISGIYNFELP
ncbi:IS5 family transposase [Orientia tsutsugamushi]|uniref:IS5 family transposase n=1 Tax=Orientia tsutsugamushi TaxID=784 RepID=UPI000D65162A|nr:IS5 family transposase [Orientia tsutsugamushi]